MREEQHDAVDRLLDRATDQIRRAEPDAEAVDAAGRRVWETLTRRGITLVPDDGALPEPARSNVASLEEARRRRTPNLLPWAIAALVLVGVGVAQLVLRGAFPSGPSAIVQTVDGQLFEVAEEAHLPLADGAEVAEDQAVRTGREGGAVLRLADGSLVEMRARSELYIEDGRGGTTIHLERGSVIVEAADQRQKHLYVATDECLVSVTGTIFSVDHGTKGSRVAVIEGEVHVDHDGDESVLTPGDQLATRPSIDPMPFRESLAWSRGLDHYLEVLGEYGDLKRELAQMPHPDLRYESQLLELMPPETVVYAAAPNLGETLGSTHDMLVQRLEESPALSEWAGQNGLGFRDELDRAFQVFAELGTYLGDEVVVGVVQRGGEVDGMVALAETVDPEGLYDLLQRQLEEHDATARIVFVDDPLQPLPRDDDALFTWSSDDLTVASDDPAQLRAVAERLGGASNPFVASPFYDSILSLYGEGAELLVAVDVDTLVELQREPALDGETDGDQEVQMLGVDDVRHLLLEQKRAATRTQHRASVTFDQARSGLAAWLAEPAPMGTLEFVSPDAKLVFSAVFQDPAVMLDDVLAVSDGLPDPLRAFEEEYGLSLRDDVAATLGGELTFALDGPLLPTPSWKLVAEVYDPARLQFAIEQALVEANRQLAAEGEEPVELTVDEIGGRTVYSLPTRILEGSFEIHYTFVEGYLLMASNTALLDQAIRYRDSGYSLVQSPRFLAQMPADGRTNFSALVYQDLSSVVQTVAETLGNGEMTPEQRAQLEALAEENKPMLGYAYGEDERIVFAASTEGDFVSNLILRFFGLKDPAGMDTMLQGLFGA